MLKSLWIPSKNNLYSDKIYTFLIHYCISLLIFSCTILCIMSKRYWSVGFLIREMLVHRMSLYFLLLLSSERHLEYWNNFFLKCLLESTCEYIWPGTFCFKGSLITFLFLSWIKSYSVYLFFFLWIFPDVTFAKYTQFAMLSNVWAPKGW